LHRDGQPAATWYDKNGNKECERWSRDGRLCHIGVLAAVIYHNIDSEDCYWIGNNHTKNITKFRDAVKGDAIHDALRPLPIPIREAIIDEYCYQ
jgi:hypothetical protein